MPITTRERKKVSDHNISEEVANDMMYFTPGQFSIGDSINNGAKRFKAHYKYLFFGVPDAVVVTLMVYVITTMVNLSKGVLGIFGLTLTISIPFLLLPFLFFFIYISAPLSGYYKSRLAGIKYVGTLKSIISSLSILQPLGYASILASIMLVITLGIFNWASLIAIIIGIILYFISINQSLLPYFLIDTKGNRSDAISQGWLLLSNNSLKIASLNILIFLPTIVFLLLFLLSYNPYLLIISFVSFILSEGIWYGTTVYIHEVVVKGSKNNKIY